MKILNPDYAYACLRNISHDLPSKSTVQRLRMASLLDDLPTHPAGTTPQLQVVNKFFR